MTQRKEWKTGVYQAHWEEPDLLVAVFTGHVDLEAARSATALYQQLGEKQPYFAIVHISEGALSPEGREYFAKNLNPAWFHSVIYVDQSIVHKSMAKAMSVALYHEAKPHDFRYVNTEAEARALVEQLRAQLPRATRSA